MKLQRWGFILLAACLAASACSSARYESLNLTGGVVAIPANSSGNRAKAVKLMDRKCPNGYLVTSEGEYPLGTVSTQDISTQPNIFDGTDVRQTSRTRITTEWRMEFTCN